MTWPEMPLGEAVEVTMGRQRSPKHAAGDHMIPYLRSANVQDGRLDLSDVKRMNFSEDEQDKYALVDGDVLVTEGSGSIETVGAAARWDSSVEGPVGFQNTLLRLRAKQGTSTPGYVYHLARWLYWTGQWAAVAKGTNIHHIGSRRAANAMVPIPPLDVQGRIVDLIDAIDMTFSRVAAEAASARLALRALREELLSRVSETGSVYDLATIEASLVDPTEDSNRQLPHLGIDCIESGTGEASGWCSAEEDGVTSSKFLFTPQDVIYSKIRPELEKAAYPAMTGLASADAYPLRPREGLDAEFVLEVLLSRDFVRQAVQRSGRTKMPKINRTELGQITVPLPSDAEASRIAEVLTTVRRAAQQAEKYGEHLQEVRSGVLAELFAGHVELDGSYDRFLGEVAA